ncbi:MAG TPA: glycoside hydrolase family 38 C-terminal domain-containing protein, partial [Clostridia bacterium]|nr:glycoside hydrolase family 38 C-terminal domain-containing protein [Clostridia bacterium]
HVNWQERGRMLRTSFAVDVTANEVTCDIQFGNIKRPNHANTSWDAAKYEICAQKWLDISQTDKGVALLNDCKYGHAAAGNVISLNLLRATESPDVNADIGEHEFTYSLYPHSGNHFAGCVNRAGYELNMPLAVLGTDSHKGTAPECYSFASVDNPSVVIETVKRAEDDSGIILRLYEADGSSAVARVITGFDVKSAVYTDLLENEIAGSIDPEIITLSFKPFEIKTLKLFV